MIWIARILAGLLALFFLYTGVNTLLSPESLTEQFGIEATGAIGRSSIRADFGAFFLGIGIMGLVGLLPHRHQWLLGAGGLCALALIGRALGVFDGTVSPTILSYMLIELITVILFAAVWWLLTGHGRGARTAAEAADAE